MACATLYYVMHSYVMYSYVMLCYAVSYYATTLCSELSFTFTRAVQPHSRLLCKIMKLGHKQTIARENDAREAFSLDHSYYCEVFNMDTIRLPCS